MGFGDVSSTPTRALPLPGEGTYLFASDAELLFPLAGGRLGWGFGGLRSTPTLGLPLPGGGSCRSRVTSSFSFPLARGRPG